MRTPTIISLSLLVILSFSFMPVLQTRAQTSAAEKIVRIDASDFGTTAKETDITRVKSLFNQLTDKYELTRTEVGDKVVYGTRDLLREKYGIKQKIQSTMEDLNSITFPDPKTGDFDKLLVAYATLRNSGSSRQEAVDRLSSLLLNDDRALDKLIKK